MDGVELYYFGHSSFLWIVPSGGRILIDPFGNPGESRTFPSYGTPGARWLTRAFPPAECDVLLITHPHFDHDAVDRVRGSPTILQNPLVVRGRDFRIQGFTGRHARHFGQEFGQRNIIFVVEAAGIVFCHIGDNRADLPETVLEALGRLDVLMVPVDNMHHLLTYEEVDRIVAVLDPAVVLPTHYALPGLTDPAAPLGGLEDWLETRSHVRHIGDGHTRLTLATLPENREVWVFDDTCGAPCR